ncbi:MAG: hypothetical protein PHW77_03840 [Eubacteriales bacterium]|nr:hypothetical protein [Eubacteriales bacterium]
MKKYLLILITLLLLLYSCGGGTSNPSDESTRSSGTSGDFSAVSECSEESFENPEQRAEFLAEAVRLIMEDAEITSLIILGDIYRNENNINSGTVLYPLSSDNEYYDYSVLEALVGSVYTAEGSRYVLNFPSYGTKTVVNVSGTTWYSTHYTPQYTDYPLTIEVLYLEEDYGSVSITTKEGLDVTAGFVKTAEGWRMEECLYKSVTDAINSQSSGEGCRSTAMSAGSAASLTGSCLIINVFLSDRVSEWNDADVEKTLLRLDRACVFTEGMANYYGASLDMISTDKTSSLYLETLDKIPTDINEFIWMDLLFSDTVYLSLSGYAEHYFDLENYDNWCVMFHLNKKGRSYAVPCDTANSDWEHYIAERCVVFHTDDDTYAYYDSAGVYAHELFHLYGAVDLYNPFISSADNALLDNYFPNDIMRMIPFDIELASVSPFTAFKLGWMNYLDDQFMFLID